ncbi:MAG: hypothetical protein QM791_19455 [Ferruginibacter sp.]
MKTGNLKKRILSLLFIAGTLTATAHIPGVKDREEKSIISKMDLKAVALKSTAEISWKALQQIKVRRYELEKSTDGLNYTYVTAIAGNTPVYAVEDKTVMDGMNYYRLKIVDNDGNLIYTKSVSINKTYLEEIKVTPAVVEDELFIWMTGNTQISDAVISDIAGRKINRNFPLTNFSNGASLKLGRLPAGVYNVNVTTTVGTTANLKFAKK